MADFLSQETVWLLSFYLVSPSISLDSKGCIGRGETFLKMIRKASQPLFLLEISIYVKNT